MNGFTEWMVLFSIILTIGISLWVFLEYRSRIDRSMAQYCFSFAAHRHPELPDLPALGMFAMSAVDLRMFPKRSQDTAWAMLVLDYALPMLRDELELYGARGADRWYGAALIHADWLPEAARDDAAAFRGMVRNGDANPWLRELGGQR